MHIRNAASLTGVGSPHGEVVYELIGQAAGGSQRQSLAQIVLPPGKASRKHYHPVAEESYYILSGSAEIELDGQRAALGPGDSIILPAPQVHQPGEPSSGGEPVNLFAVRRFAGEEIERLVI